MTILINSSRSLVHYKLDPNSVTWGLSNYEMSMLKLMFTYMELCDGFWLAESEAVSQSDDIIQFHVIKHQL